MYYIRMEAEQEAAALAATASAAGAAPAATTDVEIEAADVLRLMMQFMRENNLPRSMAALQEETGVSLNIVDSGDALLADVLAGRWEAVLGQLSGFALPPPLQMTIYEQIVRELVEAREVDAARVLLRSTLPLLQLKREEPARYSRLEHLLTMPAWDATEAYPRGAAGQGSGSAGGKEAVRRAIARALPEHLVSAPPSRLLALLSQAVKWQVAQGAFPADAHRYDLFVGCVPLRRDAEERACTLPVLAGRAADGGSGGSRDLAPRPALRFGTAAFPVCAEFTPDGATLVVGCVDGIIECYDAETCKLRLGDGGGGGAFSYQARDEFMLHDDAVLCLAASRPGGELLATGGRDGVVKVWRLRSGECVRKLLRPHDTAAASAASAGGGGAATAAAAAAGGVTALAFLTDGSQLATGGLDGTVKVHGLRSGKTLRELRGHTAAITSLAALPAEGGGSGGGGLLVSASADGTARIWRGAECVAIVTPPAAASAAATADAAVLCALPIPRSGGALLVVPRGGTAVIVSARGAVLRTLQLPPSASTRAPVEAEASPPAAAASSAAAPEIDLNAIVAASSREAAALQRQHQDGVGLTAAGVSTGAGRSGGAGTGPRGGGGAPPVSLLPPAFVCAAVSPQGRFVYAVAEDRGLYVFAVATGRLVAAVAPVAPSSLGLGSADASGGAGDAQGLAHHPLRNLLASFGPDGALRLWRAAAPSAAAVDE